jgi:alpha-1,3-mannosyltransferase
MNRDDFSVPKLECPSLAGSRYDYLRIGTIARPGRDHRRRYFFALNLHDSTAILPRLLGSVVEVIKFLGPQACAISVVEGRSTDGTYEILYALKAEVEYLGAKFYLQKNEADPLAKDVDRIATLAALRNDALKPLLEQPNLYAVDETTIIFLNDVVICADDILELVHQRQFQQADMTCAMDWTYVGKDPTFYDVWIARDMRGESFFEIPAESGSYDRAWNLFWISPWTKQAFDEQLSFQVFSCWNGAVSIGAKPFMEKQLRFRGPFEEECYEGEPVLLCKDMWMLGFSRIAVVPTVNLAYDIESAEKVKNLKGYASNLIHRAAFATLPEEIDWRSDPPEIVKCMPDIGSQTWTLWDQGLSRHLFA